MTLFWFVFSNYVVVYTKEKLFEFINYVVYCKNKVNATVIYNASVVRLINAFVAQHNSSDV